MTKEHLSSENILELDHQAKQIGIGGMISPEQDESLYKQRMQQRKDIQSKRIKIRKEKKGLLIVFTGTVSYTHLTLPTTPYV